MLALEFDRFGEPAEVVRAREVETPEPGPGDVRLRVVLSPIHNHDLATIRGIYGVKPSLPAVGGTELLGLLDGKRVALVSRGAWAGHVVVEWRFPCPTAFPTKPPRSSWLCRCRRSRCSTICTLPPETGWRRMRLMVRSAAR